MGAFRNIKNHKNLVTLFYTICFMINLADKEFATKYPVIPPFQRNDAVQIYERKAVLLLNKNKESKHKKAVI